MEESNARQLTAAVALVDEAVLRERDTCEQLEREVAVANQARETAQRALASASANTAAAVAAARSGLANKLQAAQEAHVAELAKVCHHQQLPRCHPVCSHGVATPTHSPPQFRSAAAKEVASVGARVLELERVHDAATSQEVARLRAALHEARSDASGKRHAPNSLAVQP